MPAIDSSVDVPIRIGMNGLQATSFGPKSADDADQLAASLAHRQQLEFTFCRDFVCCGQTLESLHDLLQHGENHHAHIVTEETHRSFNDLPLTEWVKQQPIETDATHITNQDLRALENGEAVQPDNPRPDSPPPTPTQPVDTPALLLDDVTIAKTIRRLSSSLISTQEWMAQVNALFKLQERRSDKPYKCCVHGCGKAYKNANGLKYHKIHGHCDEKLESDVARSLKKPFTCTIGLCRKRYKNLNGLKYHVESTHVAQLCQTLPLTPP